MDDGGHIIWVFFIRPSCVTTPPQYNPTVALDIVNSISHIEYLHIPTSSTWDAQQYSSLGYSTIGCGLAHVAHDTAVTVDCVPINGTAIVSLRLWLLNHSCESRNRYSGEEYRLDGSGRLTNSCNNILWMTYNISDVQWVKCVRFGVTHRTVFNKACCVSLAVNAWISHITPLSSFGSLYWCCNNI